MSNDLVWILAAELRAQTGHFEDAPQGIAQHDRRGSDGTCQVCRILQMVQERR